MQTDAMADLDGAVADAVKLKFLDAPLTKEQLAEFLQIPPRSDGADGDAGPARAGARRSRLRSWRPRAVAADKLKVAIGQIDAWANQMPTLGMQAGIFQKHGIELENFGTQGAGETLQAVISGSADIGIGIGTSGAMRAFVARRADPGDRRGLCGHRRSVLVRASRTRR